MPFHILGFFLNIETVLIEVEREFLSNSYP
jgi:hypothetical protein